jgi:hypothetical protein
MRAAADNAEGYMTAIGFGQQTAMVFLGDKLTSAGIPADRQQVLLTVMQDAWNQGIFDPEQLRSWMGETTVERDAYGNEVTVTRAATVGYPPLSQQELELLYGAMGAYVAGRDRWGSLQPSGDSWQNTGSMRRGGEAPNNRSFAAAARRGEGPYGARAQRVTQLSQQLLAQYPTLRSAGQWRPLDAEVTGDRSANSDHYSGGALDFTGPRADMERMLADLKKRPDVSFAKIHGSPPHVHASFML